MTLLVPILLIAATTSTAAESRVRVPRVLIAPTVSGEAEPKEPKLEDATLKAFSGAFSDAAIEVFVWRRFQIVAGETATLAIETNTNARPCRNVLCTREAAYAIGSTHALFSRLTMMRDGSCVVAISLYDFVKNKESQRKKEFIRPCTADNVLNTAIDLGRKVADGPRAPVNVTVDLTPLELRSLDVATIPDLELFATTTSSTPRARRGFSLERALEVYKEKHMIFFEDASHPGGAFVARGGKLINECDIRRAASAPLDASMREFCDGNHWEWAWSGVPLGLLFTGLSARELADGSGTLAFVFGVTLTVASAVVGIFVNVDAVDVEEGVHYSSHGEVERIVSDSNQTLREVLDLTEAEVRVAGMRK